MLGFFKKYKEAKVAQQELTAAFKLRGHNFMTLNSTVHEALVKEAVATGVEATIQNFDHVELIYLGRHDDIVRYYKERSKQFS
jgi:predicted 3-demethylubiquinone-9 3-methyltransferase (glyoxalase superfamily)